MHSPRLPSLLFFKEEIKKRARKKAVSEHVSNLVGQRDPREL